VQSKTGLTPSKNGIKLSFFEKKRLRVLKIQKRFEKRGLNVTKLFEINSGLKKEAKKSQKFG